MIFSLGRKAKYSSVEDAELPEYDGEPKHIDNPHHLQKIQVSFGWLTVILLLCIPLTSVTTLLISHFPRPNAAKFTPPSVPCSQPPIRREWRTLDSSEKINYVNAVQCLATLPSKLGHNSSVYDDFPWVHKRTATSAHQSAPFLPWHRLYIHAYEKALKEQCAYIGVLPYWDWSQDWQHFEDAPIWDSKSGFGGDGGINGASSVGNGRCVENGPFANMEAKFYDDQVYPHCLSRGFAKGDDLRNLSELISPSAIEDLMMESNFEVFAPELERRAHTFISRSIQGDFSKYTGPYDPVFFLHHTNLDRLWSKWQHTHDANAYAGKANMLTHDAASMDDMLDVGGLIDRVPVSEVMDTTSKNFCYQY